MPIDTAQTIDTGVLNALNAVRSERPDVSGGLQGQFMELLITQLRNQDPLNPLDNSEMTAQLAQINTVEGIQQLNATLSAINDQIGAGQSLQAAALIGKGVLVPGNRVLMGADGTTTPFGIELDSPADEVLLTIRDGAGQPVRRFEVGALDAGMQSFAWDGRLDDGTQAPQGAYTVFVEASSDGRAIPSQQLNYALVTGVIRGDDGPLLDLGGVADQVGLDEVRQIL